MIDKGVCNEGYFFNPSNCKCECDTSCGIGEYLDYLKCKYRKELIDPLVEDCTENIDETKLVNKTLDKNQNKDQCCSCIVYIVLFCIFFAITVGIGIYFVYSHWYLKKYSGSVTLIHIKKH